jgi:predicted transcriptional regulator
MRNVQRRLRKILSKGKSEREVALRELAQQLGCSLSSTYGGDGGKHLEDELVRRIQEAARSIREARLWWIAVISAIASVVSALAAWTAVILSSRIN